MAVKKKGRPKKKKRSVKKKARPKVKVGAVSRTTGKKPTTRLKKRRKVNKKKGYYPNPAPTFYVVYVRINGEKFYYHGFIPKKGMAFKDKKEGALWYRTKIKAINEVAYLVEKSTTKTQRRRLGEVEAESYRPK